MRYLIMLSVCIFCLADLCRAGESLWIEAEQLDGIAPVRAADDPAFSLQEVRSVPRRQLHEDARARGLLLLCGDEHAADGHVERVLDAQLLEGAEAVLHEESIARPR